MSGEAIEQFQRGIEALGYRLVQNRGTGTVQYSLNATPYLTYWIHWHLNDGTVLFTWELAIGEYVSSIGLQIGANEELNQFLFPKYDARGTQDISFVLAEMERVEQILRSLDLLGG